MAAIEAGRRMFIPGLKIGINAIMTMAQEAND